MWSLHIDSIIVYYSIIIPNILNKVIDFTEVKIVKSCPT